MDDTLKSKLSISHQIGAGHFGSVYEAREPVLGKVAVKIFSKASDETEQDWNARKSQLLKEGQTLKEAEHQNIVRVHQILESYDDDSIYLVMEFCEGGSLQSQFAKGPMQLSTLRKALCDIALGLQTIHARGMIHRDIKPANILLAEDGRAKLGDFGLVTNEFILGYATAAGYLDHLAKETFDLGITSIRTDIWAFGMTVYRLLHGKLFYEKLSLARNLVPEGGFAQKLSWLPHVPSSWRRFIRQAMHDDPDKRFQNSVELLKGLEKLPANPEWQCDYRENSVTWTRIKKMRKIELVWTKHSLRKYEWEARSYPLDSVGRTKRIGGSDGITGFKEAEKQLRDFFDDSH